METLAWVSVRAAVRPFLSNHEIVSFLGALHGQRSVAESPRATALEAFANELVDVWTDVDRVVKTRLAPEFDEDQCFALVAFAGMVRHYPNVCRISIDK